MPKITDEEDPERDAVVQECEDAGGCGEDPCVNGLLYDEEKKVEAAHDALREIIDLATSGASPERLAQIARKIVHPDLAANYDDDGDEIEPEPRPTTTCARCGQDFLDRDMMPKPNGESELCHACHAIENPEEKL